MSMEHKAYSFDWSGFEIELCPILLSALNTDDRVPLLSFIDLNIRSITDPYEGEKLSHDWQEELGVLPVQDVADHALTKYYSVDTDFGIGENWMEITDKLSQTAIDALLGNPLDGFDPGYCGAYFQSSAQLTQNRMILSTLDDPIIQEYVLDLSRMKQGLYVTF